MAFLARLADRFMHPQQSATPGIVGAMVGAAADVAIDRFAERVGVAVPTAARQEARAAAVRAAPVAIAHAEASAAAPGVIPTSIASNNPVAVNNRGDEALRSSRTFMQAVGTVVGGLGIVGTQLAPLLSALDTGGVLAWWNLLGFFLGIGVTGGGFFGIMGRIRNDLPPMTRKPYNPLSWFAPKRLADTVPPPT